MAQENSSKRFVVDYATAVSRFGSAMQKFPLKQILYKSIFRGRGLEFDSYRDFTSEDDSSLIDWMATLRAKKTIARKYVEERDLDIYFIVDVSNSMLFGSRNKLKAEYAAEMILALSHLIINSGDKVGLVLINDSIKFFLKPDSGRKHFFSLVRFLSDPENYGGDFSLEEPLDRMRTIIKNPYSVFIIVSDFIRLHSGIESSLRYITSRYETLAIMVRDPFDDTLPDTNFQFSISDPFSNRQTILDPKLAKEDYERIVASHKQKVKQLFVKMNIDLIELNTEEDFSIPIASFLRTRAKGERI